MLSTADPVGVRYLGSVTTLLQRRRLADPDGEVWEAADLQWWWPRDRHDERGDARVWYDGAEPVAATVYTRWGPERVGCDVLADPGFGPAWEFAARRSVQLGGARIEMAVPEDDPQAQDAARRAGQHDRPHQMTGRRGAHVEAGLNDCSLYAPGLDLAVLAPDGAVAGYALFWPDPVTGVGLVEPMRVEDEHAGQGLARHLLDAGLRGLVDRGCTRLKVSMEPANTAAVRLYAGAGFVVSRLDRTWLRAR